MSEKVPVPNVTEVLKKDFAKMTETAAPNAPWKNHSYADLDPPTQIRVHQKLGSLYSNLA